MATLLEDFYRGKRVFITGHTGFKGSWMCKILANAGAIVTGYSLAPNTTPSLFEIAGLDKDIHSVIGGGDFANDRIIPDSVRAAQKGEDIVVRNPYSTRPYQHVLEPLYAYLMIAAKQYGDNKYADYYNVGPDDVDCFQTGALVDLFISKWGEGLKWINKYDGEPHEANFLKLDCSKLKSTFGWTPRWNLHEAMDKIVEWSKCWLAGGDVRACMDKQIDEFLSGVK